MYKLAHFTEKDRENITSFMLQHPFATLMGCNELCPVATQIPVLVNTVDDTIVLRGHIMRNTDHYKAFESNPNALVFFQGAQCYISASWYDERGHGSTWNYMTVQAKGKLVFYNDDETIQLLKDLTHKFEDQRSNPELLENMEASYVNSNVKAIAGFEMKIDQLDATFKLSQNRNDESYKSIVNNLLASNEYNEQQIAVEMIARRKSLFER